MDSSTVTLYLLHHVDALITLGVGVLACLLGYVVLRARHNRHRSPAQKKAARVLRICGPALLVIGGLQFIPVPHEKTLPPENSEWVRVKTLDEAASVEFPGKPEGKQETYTDGGVSVQRTSLVYVVRIKDISLHLSFSPLPQGMEGLTEAQRMMALKDYFSKQGFTIVRDSKEPVGETPGFMLEMQRNGGKVRVWVRTAVARGNVYRVVASSTDGYEDDPVIQRFLKSFQIEK